ncbi:CO/xanthine dehydrogenase Mo-binding subunit [Rhodoligotrophos appendicifer]|uniref:molybdopterin cofactor-binding domain-containing protein n=1 Tax=Rhodoligotrophos appendicifer TaxID=987056 RepID=UPI001185FB4F|nr:molybdopterin cofactor-binding domain-containing protein [Rhodoligotrophos appendicifer]
MAAPRNSPFLPSRRGFIKIWLGAAGGLAIGRMLPVHAEGGLVTFQPNPFVIITPDDIVTIIVKHLEMGQGIETGLAMLVADEMDAARAQIRTRFAPTDASRFHNLLAHGLQATLASTSMANAFLQYRHAGAIARAMMVGAAAKYWGIARGHVKVAAGQLISVRGHRASFGAMAARAAALEMPIAVDLKRRDEFVFVGRSFKRLDTPAKCNGSAVYAADIKREAMLVAVVARPERFGGRAMQVDEGAARAVPGVVAIVPISRGIAVVAETSWAAIKAKRLLKITWNDTDAEIRSSSEIMAHHADLAGKPGVVIREDGDIDAAAKGAATVIQADFHFPYLAHTPMETLDLVLEQAGGRARLWVASHVPGIDQANVAFELGIASHEVEVITVYAADPSVAGRPSTAMRPLRRPRSSRRWGRSGRSSSCGPGKTTSKAVTIDRPRCTG